MWEYLREWFNFDRDLNSVLMIVVPFLLCNILLALFKDKLPRDKGREFALNGKRSAGKPRGAGLIIIASYVVCAVLLLPMEAEVMIYHILTVCCMIAGYLDDGAKTSWNEYKKGLIDLVISALTAVTYVNCNPGALSIGVFGYAWSVPPVLFAVFATILLWVSINATNCSDGVDGLCGSVSIITMVSVGIVGLKRGMQEDILSLILIMVFALLPYLWRNQEPSQMIMGDAGSRAIGLFIGVACLKTGNMLLYLPLGFVLLADGFIGIIKVSCMRFLKIRILANVRTPLHDYFRGTRGWSTAQLNTRFQITQIIISAVAILLS